MSYIPFAERKRAGSTAERADPPADIAAALTSAATPSPAPPEPRDVDERAAVYEFHAGLARPAAEDAAARDFGFKGATAYRRQLLRSWDAGLWTLRNSGKLDRGGEAAVASAQAFIREGWALQALRLGWLEEELMWCADREPWVRHDVMGVAYYRGRVTAITETTVVQEITPGSQLVYRRRKPLRDGLAPPWHSLANV